MALVAPDAGDTAKPTAPSASALTAAAITGRRPGRRVPVEPVEAVVMAVLLSAVRGAAASGDRTTDARNGLRRRYDGADPIRS